MMTTSTFPADMTVRRKVTASGVIWLDGRSYYVSRRLAGRTIPLKIDGGKLVVEAMIPLHKEYHLPGQTVVTPHRPRTPRPPGQSRTVGL